MKPKTKSVDTSKRLSDRDSANVKTAGRKTMSIEEIRRTIASAKQQGLLRGPGEVVNGHAPAAAASTALLPKCNGKIESGWMDVTPAMAREWLRTCNVDNRRIKEETVSGYARDMKAGEWRESHQGIAFDDKNRLLDGQHRLRAIDQSGATIRLLVTTGLPAEVKGKRLKTRDAMDRGVPRSIADQLKLQHGAMNPNLTAGAARVIAQICTQGKRVRKYTLAEVLGVLEIYGEPVQTYVAQCCAGGGRSRSPIRRAGVIGAIAFAAASHGRDVETFFEGLMSGAGLAVTSPVLALRNFLLLSQGQLMLGGEGVRMDRMALIALNCVMAAAERKPHEELSDVEDGAQFFRAAQKAAVAKVVKLFE